MKNLLSLFSTVLLFGFGNHCFAQSIFSLAPNAVARPATRADTVIDVVIRGMNTHFQNGISTVSFGSGITVQKFVVANTVTGTATIMVPSCPGSGTNTANYTVTVNTRTESAVITNGFELFCTPANTLTGDIVILPMESISLKNIDLTNPATTPELFYVNIYNNNVSRTLKDSVVVSSTSLGVIGYLAKSCYPLAANANVDFTNQQFNAVQTMGVSGQAFLNQVESTGAFPPDNYTYELFLIDCTTGKVLLTTSATTTITNPLTDPELITPGNNMTSAPPAEYNPLPLFQWFGQNNQYDFALYECRPGQTPEEVVRNIPKYKQQGISGNSLLLPTSAVQLVNGQTYAWQVQGNVLTATSTHYLPSEVFWFTYTDINTAGKPIVSTIALTPEEVTVLSGQTCQFTATYYDQNGNIMADSSAVWSVTPGYGTITQNGLFTAGQGGNTVAVLVNAGMATEFSTVTVSLNASGILSNLANPFSGFLKKLFGLK